VTAKILTIDWLNVKIQMPYERIGINSQNVDELNIADLPIKVRHANFSEFNQTNTLAYKFWNLTNQT